MYFDNIKNFRKYIRNFQIPIKEEKFGRETIFKMESQLSSGYKSSIVCVFQEFKPTYFDIFYFNHIKVDKEIIGEVYSKINELNLKYALIKFVIDEDRDLCIS